MAKFSKKAERKGKKNGKEVNLVCPTKLGVPKDFEFEIREAMKKWLLENGS